MRHLWIIKLLGTVLGLATCQGLEGDVSNDPGLLPSGGRLIMIMDQTGVTRVEAERRCNEEFSGMLYRISTLADLITLENYLLPQSSARGVGRYYRITVWTGGTTSKPAQTEIDPSQNITAGYACSPNSDIISTGEQCIEIDNYYYHTAPATNDHMRMMSRPCKQKKGFICQSLPEEIDCVNSLRVADLPADHFSSSSEDSSPQNISLFGEEAWIPKSFSKQWLRIDLRNVTMVTGLVTRGSDAIVPYGSWVSQYRLAYSIDQWDWSLYQENDVPVDFLGNSNPVHTRTNMLSKPIKARYVALLPRSYYRGIAVKLDLYGCTTYETTVPTMVDQDITSKELWHLSASPYVISKSILLGAGGDLTIDAGVKVLFTNKEAGITVKGGCIHTRGTPDLMTVFKPGYLKATINGVGSWQGIDIQLLSCTNVTLSGVKVEGALNAVTVKVDTLNIHGAKFIYNQNGVQVKPTSSGGTVSIGNSIFRGNSQRSVWSNLESNLSISKSTFNGTSVGIFLDRDTEGGRLNVALTDVVVNATTSAGLQVYPRNTDLVLNNCEFNHNHAKSIEVHSKDKARTSSKVSIYNNRLTENSGNYFTIILGARYAANMTVEVKDTVLENNNLGMSVDCTIDMNVLLENVTLSGHNRRGFMMQKYGQGCKGNLTVRRSQFHKNKDAFTIAKSYVQLNPMQVFIENNTFSDNTEDSVISVTTSGDDNYVAITKNIFSTNTATNTISLDLSNVNKNGVIVTHNIFENPDVIELSIDATWEPGTHVDARHNWWGTVDLTDITYKLSDFYRNVRRVPAMISPIQSSRMTAFKEGNLSLERYYAGMEDGIGGKLTTDVTIASGSKLRVLSSIHIPYGMTLSVGEGSVLYFTLSTGILVEGVLLLAKNVVLQPDGDGMWGGLIYYNTSGQTIHGAYIGGASACVRLIKSSIELNSTLIEKCENGIYHSANDKSSLKIVNSTIKGCQSRGITVYGSGTDEHMFNLDLDEVDISNNEVNQIYIDSKSLAANVSMRHSTLSNTGASRVGIMMSFQKGHVDLFNNTVQSADGWDNLMEFALTTSGENTTFIMRSNRFIYDGQRGSIVRMDIRSLTGSPEIEMTDNEFMLRNARNRYSRAIDINAYYFRPVTVVLHGNTLECRSHGTTCVRVYSFRGTLDVSSNVFQFSHTAFYLRLGQKSNVSLVSNTFRNNSHYCFHLENSYKSEVNVTNNTFADNRGDSVLFIESVFVTASGNYFDNPLATYDLRVSSPISTGRTIQALRNWWGSASYSDVIKRIYDHSRDSKLVEVEFEPYLTSRDRTIFMNSSVHQFFLSDVKIGGILQEDITLRNIGHPYEVVKDIEVPPGRTFTLEAGVELHFSLGSLFVRGRLKSLGEGSSPVILKAAEGGSWKGVRIQEAQTGMYRLSGSNTCSAGRLEVWRMVSSTGDRPSGKFLPVCNSYWNQAMADQVCEQLGYTKAIDWNSVNPQSSLYRKLGPGDRLEEGGCFGWDLRQQTCSWSQRRNCYSQATVNCDPTGCSSPSAEYMSLRSELRWTHIVAPTEGVTVTGRPPIMYGVNVTKSKDYGMKFDGFLPTQLRIEYSQVSKTTGVGFRFEFTNVNEAQYNLESGPTYSDVYIQHCRVFDNSQYGIQFSQGSPNLTIEDTDIYSNAQTGLYISQQQASVFTIRGCNVTKNHRGLDVRFMYNVLMEDNTFSNCTGNREPYQVSNHGNHGNLEIRNNIFINHTSRYVISTLLQVDGRALEFKISNNTFTDNKANRIIALESAGDGCTNCTLTENTFTNNTAFPGYKQQVVYVKFPGLSITRNVFNNKAECEISTATRVSNNIHSGTVSAPYNYWGEQTYEAVYNRTCDFFKDASLVALDIWPFYSDRMLTRLVHQPPSGHFVGADGIGGDVIGNSVVKSRAEPYIVTRSIYIRNGGKLILERGVTLKFKEHRGLLSEGNVCFDEDAWESTILTAEDPSFPWHGLIIYLPPVAECECCRFENVILERMKNDAIQVYGSGQLNLSRLIIRHFRHDAMKLMDEGVALSVTDSLFFNATSGKAINFNKIGRLVVKNSSFTDISEQAVFMTNYLNLHTNLTVEDCSFYKTNGIILVGVTDISIARCVFQHSKTNAIDIRTQDSAVLHLSHNRFFGTLTGKSVYLKIYGIDSVVNVEFNTWSENMYECLEVYSTTYGRGNVLSVLSNVFANSTRSAIVLKSVDNVDITIRNNTFYNNTYHDGCVGIISSFGNSHSENKLSIETNDFNKNEGTSILQIDSRVLAEGSPYIKVSGNLFTGNWATAAVLQTQTYRATVERNIFINPLSKFDVKATFAMSDNTLMCPNNWWGTSDEALIPNRIFDNADDPQVGTVTWTDPLKSPEVSCHNVNNCSAHGDCRRPDVCVCHEGWAGADCGTVSCAKMYECQGNGDCVAPNVCQCQPGWLPPDCSKPTCYNRKNCSLNGVCVSPDRCYCYEGFGGEACDNCAEDRWGPLCLACPECVNGFCHPNSGVCVCSEANWAGDQCSECAETFYGPTCQPFTKVLFVTPERGPDTGGNLVHVFGHNFPSSSQYRCRFNNDEVPAEWQSKEEIVCRAPENNPGRVRVSVSSGLGLPFTNEKVYYEYYALCPESACGSREVPQRGVCSKGRCVCIKPWRGDSCSEVGLPPVITPVTTLEAMERSEFTLQLYLAEGQQPVIWRLSGNPSGMTMNDAGMVHWPHAVASERPYTLTVTCKNTYGKDEMTFKLNVPLTYHVTLDGVLPGPYPKALPMLISGRVVFDNAAEDLQQSKVPVVIRIHSNKAVRTLNVKSMPGTGIFYTRFFPSQNEYGVFKADARHPRDSGFSPQIQWSVLGMRFKPSYISLTGFVDQTSFSTNLKVTNVGNDAVLKVIAQRIPELEAMDILLWETNVTSPHCLLERGDCLLRDQMIASEEIQLTLTVRVQAPSRGMFYISLTTKGGVFEKCRVDFEFKVKRPALKVKPTRISGTVLRGSSRTFTAQVQNVGQRPATGVHVELPSDPMFSVISFGVTSEVDEDIILQPGDTAQLVFGLTPDPKRQLESLSGRIGIRAAETWVALNYVFVVASTSVLDLIVYIEDEYTYFAEDKPFLEGATVKLKNAFGGGTLERVTNASGFVVFEGITENYYNLYSSADRHTGDSRVVFARPLANRVTVFLQRTAVTYRWSVKPVIFEDRYDVTIEADFKTQVPIPVVTIDPKEVDLSVLERGLMPIINFKLTNHGLIKANNVYLKPPLDEAHPYLSFSMDPDPIGDLAANSTIHVPVLVTLDQNKKDAYIAKHTGTEPGRRKRSFLPCLALALYAGFSYLCDRERAVEMDVAIYDAIKRTCKVTPHDVRPEQHGGGDGGPDIDSCCGGPNWRPKVHVDQPITCENCLPIVLSCGSLGLPPGLKCFVPVAGSVGSNDPLGAAESIVGCFFPPASIFGCVHSVLKCFVPDETECAESAVWQCLVPDVKDPLTYILPLRPVCSLIKLNDCLNKLNSGQRRKRQTQLTQADLVPEVRKRIIISSVYLHKALLIAGDSRWAEVESPEWWNAAVTPTISDASEGGVYISQSEMNSILQYPAPNGTDKDMVETFITRLNRTQWSWDNGVLEGPDIISHSEISKLNLMIQIAEASAQQDGFSSAADWVGDAINKFNRAELKEEGVCAKVRIQIKQRLVITREAFEATLELDNGDTSRLDGIKVEIYIKDEESKEIATEKFSIGNPKLTGLSGVDGTGVLEVKEKGTAVWLIVPYSEAAPSKDVEYAIGGTLLYSVDGNEISVPLFPDTVTVKPDPRLHLNYFLEKYVRSDNPFTDDIEPPVPFSLGILITNTGYGSANQLKITSGQPTIVENEKGLLINFKLISSQLGSKQLSPSLTINFGDIDPFTTKMARWLMTSSLRGTFSNYSASFENVNPLGDHQLSIMESVNFHELSHVVRVDKPRDDGVPDFLTIDTQGLQGLPNRVYLSDGGLDPLNVSVSNITKLETLSTTNIRAFVTQHRVGWNYMFYKYDTDQPLTVGGALRQDGRQLIPEFNVWVSEINKDYYLHIFDLFETEGEHDYDISFVRTNQNRPRFTNPSNTVEVSEASMPPLDILTLKATDADQDTVVYNLLDDMGGLFSLGQFTGSLRLRGTVDREETEFYTLTVHGADSGTPSRTATTVVNIKITDVNDNAPDFITDLTKSASLEDSTQIGYTVFEFSVLDLDAGGNGEVAVDLSPSNSPFTLHQEDGRYVIRLSRPLTAGQTHTLTVTGSDRGTPVKQTDAIFTVMVVPTNAHAPQFKQSSYTFSVSENVPLGTKIGAVQAIDSDPGSSIKYTLSTVAVPFRLDGDTITVAGSLDRETVEQYIISIIAVDNGKPPTGRKSASASVTINIQDVNDIAPSFSRDSYIITIEENAPFYTDLLRLTASDNDSGSAGEIVSYYMEGDSFGMTLRLEGEAVILTTGSRELDRERLSQVTVAVVAKDGGFPPLTGTTNVTVVISDVNDNQPVFDKSQVEIHVSKATPVNSVVYTAEAHDLDTDRLTYTLGPVSNYWSISPETGRVRLSRTLTEESVFNLLLTASDGIHSAELNLIIWVATSNQEKPVFETTEYEVSILEGAHPGVNILKVNAIDADSSVITYSIVAGNDGNVFTIGALSGMITVIGRLDRETRASYDLVVRASDGGLGGVNTLTADVTVHIIVLEVNEDAPVFVSGAFVKVRIMENAPIGMQLIQLTAIDPDGGLVNYSLQGDSHILAIDGRTGVVTTQLILDREQQDMYTVNILAFDSGEPPMTSTAVLELTVVDVNDNAPIFSQPAYMVSIENARKGTRVLVVSAVDLDAGANGEVTFMVLGGSHLTVNAHSGEVTVIDYLPAGTYHLMIQATDNGMPPLSTSVKLTLFVTDGAFTPAPVTRAETPDLFTTSTTSTSTPEIKTRTTSPSMGQFTSHKAELTTRGDLTPSTTPKKTSSSHMTISCLSTLLLFLAIAFKFV